MDANGTRLPTPGAFTGKFQEIMEGAKDWSDVAKRLKGQTVTYFDFETTGIAEYDGQDISNDPIQLGAVQVKDGKIVKRFNVYMNPESKLSNWSANNLKRDVIDESGNRILDENGKPESTLVTPEWLTQQQSQEQALKDFIDFIGPNALLGGQNVPFDVEILKRMAEKSGIQLDIAGTIDSKDLASLLPKYDPEKGIDGPKAPDRKTGEIKSTSSLGPVANFLGFEPANWHSADGDAEDSYNLVSKIIDRAAAEDSKDLSLLDFPAMQKRYEERMAEFKQVVSPENPITESQQSALEALSQSSNPEVAKKAAEGLASAKTRGEAAKVLSEAHALEESGSQASEPEAKRKTGLFNEYSQERLSQGAEEDPLTDLGFDPEEEITIYRGVPKGIKDINSGDWVTANERLAKDYAGTGDVISMKVKAKDLFGDKSAGEGGYTEEMIYRPAKSNNTNGYKAISDSEDDDDDNFGADSFDLSALDRPSNLPTGMIGLDDFLTPYLENGIDYFINSTGYLKASLREADRLYRETPSETTKENYKQAIRNLLIKYSNALSEYAKEHSVGDIPAPKWNQDPILTVLEVNQLNKEMAGKVKKPISRRISPTPHYTPEQMDALLASVEANRPPIDLPDGWSMESAIPAETTGNSALARALRRAEKAGTEGTESVKRILHDSRYRAIATLLQRPGGKNNLYTLVIQSDPDKVGHDTAIRVNVTSDGARLASNEQIHTVLEELNNINKQFDLNARPFYQNSPVGRLHVNLVAGAQSNYPYRPGVLGYAMPGDVNVIIDRITKHSETSKNSGDHWSVNYDERDGMLKHVIRHEVGHSVQGSYMNYNIDQEGQGTKEFISQYGKESPAEHFAESFARYIATGEATPTFMAFLRDRGLLKSQNNN